MDLREMRDRSWGKYGLNALIAWNSQWLNTNDFKWAK